MTTARLVNFGCRLNIAEGEALRADHDDQDVIIVNSCIVTAEAERQARQAIRRAARADPDARILVSGCGARLRPDVFSAMPEVSRLLDRPRHPSTPAVSGHAHARAFIEVQNGCDHRCTFCIIPHARGESRSIPPDIIVGAVRAAVARGQQEVILTGVDLTSYGADLPSPLVLGQLVARLLDEVPDLPRLRLSSLDAVEIDPLLLALLGSHPRMMPHVHLSLQHGHDLILKRMKRRHLRDDAIALVARLKEMRPGIAIGADLIAGFPTETEDQFAESLSLLDACDIVLAHVFPYSPRAGTPAALMPQLPTNEVKARAHRLRTAADDRRASWLESLVGTTQSVLIELDGQTGHAANFAPVRLAEPLPSGNMRGTIINIRITGSDGRTLAGQPA